MTDSKPQPSRFAPLPRSQRNRVRMVARDAWFESGAKSVRAIELAGDRVRQVAGAQVLDHARALAFSLIRYWSANRIEEPESIFVSGEPGFDGGGE